MYSSDGRAGCQCGGVGSYPGPPTLGIKKLLCPLPKQPGPPFLASILCWELTALLRGSRMLIWKGSEYSCNFTGSKRPLVSLA